MSEKTAAELEQEAELQRARMADTADSLRAKMTPGQMVDEVSNYFRGTDGGLAFKNLTAQVRDNPIPAALVGLGVAWLFASSMAGPRAQGGQYRSSRSHSHWDGGFDDDYAETGSAGFDSWSSDQESGSGRGGPSYTERGASALSGVAHATSSAAQAVGGAVTSAASGLAGAASAAASALKGAAGAGASGMRAAGHGVSAAAGGIGSATSSLGGAAGSLRHRATSGARYADRRLRTGASQLMGVEPLILAGMGVAVGAAIGAAFPSTRLERETVGPYRDDVGEKVRQAADTVMHQASDMAHEAFDALKESVDEAGLKQQGANLAADLGEVLSKTVGTVDSSVRDKLTGLTGGEQKANDDQTEPQRSF